MATFVSPAVYAALTVEEADATKVLHLDDAETIVLNQALGLERAGGLGLRSRLGVHCSIGQTLQCFHLFDDEISLYSLELRVEQQLEREQL